MIKLRLLRFCSGGGGVERVLSKTFDSGKCLSRTDLLTNT